MNNEWYQSNPIPFPYPQHNTEMMRNPKPGHGGGYHGPHNTPNHHSSGHGKHPHGPHGGFQGGLPFLGGLAGGLLLGSLYNTPGAYPYGPNPNYGYYPPYPQTPYPPYQNSMYPPYSGYY